MKNITISKKDAYDLAAVMATVVREQSEKLDFKEVIGLQKFVNYTLDIVKDFSDKYEEHLKEQKSLVDAANGKISSFKKKLMGSADKSGEVPEDYKEKVEAFVNLSLEELQTEIAEGINPKFTALNDGIGKDEVTLELEEERHKMLVINFEKFAKEKYTNKSKMVEVYEKLTV